MCKSLFSSSVLITLIEIIEMQRGRQTGCGGCKFNLERFLRGNIRAQGPPPSSERTASPPSVSHHGSVYVPDWVGAALNGHFAHCLG